nr:MAG TPA: capsid protein [Caudoviricetes sp.]
MAILSQEVVNFAKGNTDFYVAFADYHNHKAAEEWGQNMGSYDKSRTIAEKAPVIREAYFAELERISGQKIDRANMDVMLANPMLRYANFALINATINVVLPAYVAATFAPFVDFRTVGYADVVNLKIPPKTLYTVSRGARGERTSFRQKKYSGNVEISPIEHIITTYVDMARVFAGKDDLADAVRAIIMSIEIDMNNEIIASLNAGLNEASYPEQFVETGAFDGKKLVQLSQRVQAYNMMSKPVIMGTAAALMNVLPDSTLGGRLVIDGRDPVVSYVRDFYGFGIYELPQAPTGKDFGLALDDNTLYVVSAAVAKPIVGVMSTTLTNSNQFYENADISQNFTVRKSYDFEFVGAAYVGKYTINE